VTSGGAAVGQTATNGSGSRDSLIRSWNEVAALRRSAQQFSARLLRTAPVVGELAVSYPGCRDALKVVNVLVHNVSLAQDVLERMPLPEELAETAT
jgi:hypothetical protein